MESRRFVDLLPTWMKVLGWAAMIGLIAPPFLATGWGGFSAYLSQRETSRFVAVPARILESEIVSIESDPDLDRSRFHGHVPHITYRYEVDGRVFVRDRYHYDRTDDPPGPYGRTVRAIVARYPEGSTHTVWIDPGAPGRSVLETGPPEGPMLEALAGMLFFASMPILVAILPALTLLGAAAQERHERDERWGDERDWLERTEP